ncbi:hypothetical protein ACQKC9_03435 [Psychrobacter sp. NPDC078409]|uniref:hypothetical protein n=1 Tax=Psychrobacter sp. NPDC078409 TaxID=3390660 RepID=UPI003D02074A
MSQSVKGIFYHVLLARAAYSEMKSNDFQDWSLLEGEAGQSTMYADMVDFI